MEAATITGPGDAREQIRVPASRAGPVLPLCNRRTEQGFLMTKAVRVVLALCALVASAALVAGCGGVPGNAVAEVDGEAIEKSSFDHWLNVAAKSSGQGDAQVPKPPDYKACIAAKRKTTPKPAKGQSKVTDD